MIRKGFDLFLGNRDVFVESDYQVKCDNLLKGILRELKMPDNVNTRKELSFRLQPATLEEKLLSTGVKFYSVKGDSFSMGVPANDENFIIINVYKR